MKRKWHRGRITSMWVTGQGCRQSRADALTAAIGGLAMVSVVAARMTPPAWAISDRYSTKSPRFSPPRRFSPLSSPGTPGWDGPAVSPPSCCSPSPA